jgi:endonuclease YncB( thermonuclease family)
VRYSLYLLIAFLLVFSCAPVDAIAGRNSGHTVGNYLVVRVYDGDTFVAFSKERNKNFWVRVQGIDTPEIEKINKDGVRVRVGEKCGLEARDLARFLLENNVVELDGDYWERGYRLVSTVALQDGRDYKAIVRANGFDKRYKRTLRASCR